MKEVFIFLETVQSQRSEVVKGYGIWYDIQTLVLAYSCTFTNRP